MEKKVELTEAALMYAKSRGELLFLRETIIRLTRDIDTAVEIFSTVGLPDQENELPKELISASLLNLKVLAETCRRKNMREGVSGNEG